jgi:hypothetical protein
MSVYLGKDRKCREHGITATHGYSNPTTSKIGHCHKLYIDSFFPSPRLFDDQTEKKKKNCYTVRPNRRGMPWA